jgi:hypothetical protein
MWTYWLDLNNWVDGCGLMWWVGWVLYVFNYQTFDKFQLEKMISVYKKHFTLKNWPDLKNYKNEIAKFSW